EAHYNLGNLLQDLKRFEEAEVSYRHALRVEPDFAEAHYNLGNLLHELKRFEEAEASYRQALRVEPDFAEAHYNLGNLLHELKRFEEAEASYRQALHVKPDYAEAHSNLGNLLKDVGRLDEAERSYHQALTIAPDYAHAHSGLLFTHNYQGDKNLEESLADARKYGELVASQAKPFSHPVTPADSNRRLRVGLVSGDLRNHPVGYFLEGVVEALNPADIELFAYDTFCQEDNLTQKFKTSIPHWRTVDSLSDAELAQFIQSDAIDILMDLAGHTGHNRLGMFAWKPAPVQVTWLGYFATTGVAAIDYILGDPINLPGSDRWHFVEKPWHLPDCYLCFTPPDFPLTVTPLPACTNGFVTFGCFNKISKVTAAVVACWARILLSVPDSRLFLKNVAFADAKMRFKIMEQFQQAQIASERLILEGPQTREQYLAAYNRVDLALDPFPFPGGTTSVEGLWMGVPVLTKKGNRFLSHQGETILTHAGLPDWIATDVDDYVRKAVDFANDLPGLATLRAGLRQQVLRSPLFDAPRFANNLTKAWQEMWRIWCHADRTRSTRPPEVIKPLSVEVTTNIISLHTQENPRPSHPAETGDLAKKHINLLKKSLLNELYIENELRILHTFHCILNKLPIEYWQFPNISRTQPHILEALLSCKETGNTIVLMNHTTKGLPIPAHYLRNFTELSHTMVGKKRLENIQYCVETVLRDNIKGDFIETGIWRGGSCIFMRGILMAHGVTDRIVWAADSFEGVPVPTLPEDAGFDISRHKLPVLAVSLEEVKELFTRYDLLDDNVKFLKGWFKDTLPIAPIEQLAVLRLDGDLYESTMDALVPLYDKVSPGGFIIVDDYGSCPPCKRAIHDFRAQRGIHEELQPIDVQSVYWRKDR
ncbi:MAG: tetratricopeptide repeat protein, partial [Magnetococcales bacterium]|nr:tetratricopeptide repeat protein [Magnetococcales bacterium]